jgi:hypothetical protein
LAALASSVAHREPIVMWSMIGFFSWSSRCPRRPPFEPQPDSYDFGYEGDSAFAAIEDEDVAAITVKYRAAVNPAGPSADDQTAQIMRLRPSVRFAIFEKIKRSAV